MACIASLDNVHTLPRNRLRRRITRLSDARMAEACLVMLNELRERKARTRRS
jgi:mRNA-degrading endonuclease toxin of MazEF toxin-antitoxin module